MIFEKYTGILTLNTDYFVYLNIWLHQEQKIFSEPYYFQSFSSRPFWAEYTPICSHINIQIYTTVFPMEKSHLSIFIRKTLLFGSCHVNSATAKMAVPTSNVVNVWLTWFINSYRILNVWVRFLLISSLVAYSEK